MGPLRLIVISADCFDVPLAISAGLTGVQDRAPVDQLPSCLTTSLPPAPITTWSAHVPLVRSMLILVLRSGVSMRGHRSLVCPSYSPGYSRERVHELAMDVLTGVSPFSVFTGDSSAAQCSRPLVLGAARGQHAHFHVIERGGAWRTSTSQGPRARAGDLVVLP
jgi:hypothetical protein